MLLCVVSPIDAVKAMPGNEHAPEKAHTQQVVSTLQNDSIAAVQRAEQEPRDERSSFGFIAHQQRYGSSHGDDKENELEPPHAVDGMKRKMKIIPAGFEQRFQRQHTLVGIM